MISSPFSQSYSVFPIKGTMYSNDSIHVPGDISAFILHIETVMSFIGYRRAKLFARYFLSVILQFLVVTG